MWKVHHGAKRLLGETTTLSLRRSKRVKALGTLNPSSTTGARSVLERAKECLNLPDVLFAIVRAYFGFLFEQVGSVVPFSGSPVTMMAQAPDAWAYIAWYDHINVCDESGAFQLHGPDCARVGFKHPNVPLCV